MQPHPRQAIFSGDQVLIKRLVLVPQQDDAQGRHEEKFRIARRLQQFE
jgi:hypothetical protein